MRDEHEQITAYLLGELPEEAQSAVERDFLVDDSAYERMLIAEDELAYDYVERRLTPDRRGRFEATIGATERGRANVEMARLLLDELKRSRQLAAPPGRVLYWPAAIAAAVALAVIPVWQARSFRAQIEALERQLVEAKVPPVPVPVESAFLLTPGVSRSDGAPVLELPSQVEALRLELVAPPGAVAGDYVITIHSPGGGDLWSRSSTLSGRSWVVQAPAKLFAGATYEISVRRLTAGEQLPDLATYSLRLDRK